MNEKIGEDRSRVDHETETIDPRLQKGVVTETFKEARSGYAFGGLLPGEEESDTADPSRMSKLDSDVPQHLDDQPIACMSDLSSVESQPDAKQPEDSFERDIIDSKREHLVRIPSSHDSEDKDGPREDPVNQKILIGEEEELDFEFPDDNVREAVEQRYTIQPTDTY